MIDLPRQARDKNRESTQKERRVFRRAAKESELQQFERDTAAGAENAAFGAISYQNSFTMTGSGQN
eukprot:COSAG06_NODE_51533_length_311_cov_1.023585_1_plen_65_part_10